MTKVTMGALLSISRSIYRSAVPRGVKAPIIALITDETISGSAGAPNTIAKMQVVERDRPLSTAGARTRRCCSRAPSYPEIVQPMQLV
jgi:hypothetical protein